MPRLICAGHSSCDIPLRPVDKNVFDVDTTFIEDSAVLTGGDALNATVNLNKLGLGKHVKFVSVIGDDRFGEIITTYLKERGIDTSGIIVKPECRSIVTVILIDSHNERHFLCYGNAGRSLTVDDVIANLGPDTEYLHLGSLMSLDELEHDNLRRLFSYAHEHGIQTSFDVTFDGSGEWLGRIEAGLPFTDIFFSSYDEAVSITGGLKEPRVIAEFFRKYGVKKFVLKLGADGCYATDYKEVIEIPAYTDIPVIDTTGAGDAFVAGYLFGVLKGLTMEECCVLGLANGAMAIGKLGANTGTGTVQEIKEFLKRHGALTLASEILISKFYTE